MKPVYTDSEVRLGGSGFKNYNVILLDYVRDFLYYKEN